MAIHFMLALKAGVIILPEKAKSMLIGVIVLTVIKVLQFNQTKIAFNIV